MLCLLQPLVACTIYRSTIIKIKILTETMASSGSRKGLQCSSRGSLDGDGATEERAVVPLRSRNWLSDVSCRMYSLPVEARQPLGSSHH